MYIVTSKTRMPSSGTGTTVARRERLGLPLDQWDPARGQRPRAGDRDQHLDRGVRGSGVTPAQHRTGVESRRRRGAGLHRLGDVDHRMATTRQLQCRARRPHDDHLGRADLAAQTLPRLQLHGNRLMTSP